MSELDQYKDLNDVFKSALEQASKGKGKERHCYSEDEKYSDQLICEMDRRLNGNAIGPRYQAVKKIYESTKMESSKAIHELLGAINYIAAAIILLKEKTINNNLTCDNLTFDSVIKTFDSTTDNTIRIVPYSEQLQK